MKKKEIKIIVVFISLFSVFFIALPYWVWKEEGNIAVKEEELVEIRGHVDSLIEATTAGRHSEPIMYLTLKEYQTTFRIANNSYGAINPSQVVSQLRNEAKVELKVKDSELQRSTSSSTLDNILNFFLKWRKQPQVYGLQTKDHTLLSLEEANVQENEHNFENVKWGIVLVLLVTGRFVWAAISEKKNKDVITTPKR
ncbi:hypothetical protein [Rufibacter tibetensis]|uniref:Uncharacterized protein n=1 Tax=Rufibacter tibetensis TaxID=512763 RepID=A0A0P0CLY9_9BACT|nr:hypothetical protein [Rufibacter tibetensis]ALJ00700.1 hypothetical protein DC20_19100 [Rufibacter tibetensis]